MMHHDTIAELRAVMGRLSVCLAALTVFWLVPVAEAQDRPAADTAGTRLVEILHADSSSGFTRGGHRIRSLTGDVRLKQETTRLHANRVLQYVESDSIRFVGDVEIVDEGDTLRARRVLYDQRTRVGYAEGEVVLTDGEVLLQAPSVQYYVEAKRAEFSDGARMRDSVSVLTSDLGTYWFDEKKAALHGSVRLDQPGTVLTSDSLVHFRESERSTGFGNVVINHFERAAGDTTRRIVLLGDRADHDNRRDYRQMTGDPFLVQFSFDSTGTDTLFVRADTIQARETPGGRRMQAFGGAHFWRRNFSAAADSVAYERVEDLDTGDTSAAGHQEIRLYRDPIAWMDQTQITGDTLRAAGAGEQIDSLWVHSRAFVASRDTTFDRIHQLKGESLRAAMRGNELRYVRVGPRGEALRFLSNENQQPDGAVELSADYIEGWFENGSIARAKAVRGVEGTYYEEENLPNALQLEGFQWLPERRPTKESMLENARHGEKFAPVTYRLREYRHAGWAD